MTILSRRAAPPSERINSLSERLEHVALHAGEPRSIAASAFMVAADPSAAVNGSLWTLPVEAFCYVLTPLLVMARAPLCIALALAMLGFPVTGEVAGFGLGGASSVIPWFLIGVAVRQLGIKLPAIALPALPIDLSYGLYLTAFPVQQVLIATQPGISPVALSIATTAFCIPLALALWTFIEKPAMHLRPLSLNRSVPRLVNP